MLYLTINLITTMRKHLYSIIYLFIILISISCTQDELLDTPEEGVSENQETNQGIQVQRLSKETFSLHSEVSTTIKEYVSNQKATRSIDQNALEHWKLQTSRDIKKLFVVLF